MADETKAEKKNDIYAEVLPNGQPAYPQMIYAKDGDKTYPDGSPVMKTLGVAKNPDEHKKLLEDKKNTPAWGKDK